MRTCRVILIKKWYAQVQKGRKNRKSEVFSGLRKSGNISGFLFLQNEADDKNPDSQGFKSGDFFALFAKKYGSSLDGLDSRNGHKIPIAYGVEMCYIEGVN